MRGEHMIISKGKSLDKILDMLNSSGNVFIIGCTECATLCKSGGKEEVEAMKKFLEEEGKEVTGIEMLEPACHLLNDKRVLKQHSEELERSDMILALSCGNGVQTVAEAAKMRVVPGLDTMFLGEIQRMGQFKQNCVLCGECLLDVFEGLCPVAQCAKNLMNGPCGGAKDGKCEISNPNNDVDCVWCLIHELLTRMGRTDILENIVEPKDWSKGTGLRPKKWSVR
jgi:hypothetical protein